MGEPNHKQHEEEEEEEKEKERERERERERESTSCRPCITSWSSVCARSRFDAQTLRAAFDDAQGGRVNWSPGMRPSHPLQGAPLDLGCSSHSYPEECVAMYELLPRPSLLSRDGWSLIDDTRTARMQPDGWFADAEHNTTDWSVA